MPKILITGATSGLGEALAILAASNGHNVIACGRNAQKLSALAQTDNIETIQFDATDANQTAQALANVTCDIAVLNAGTCEYVDSEAIEPALFKRVFDINVFGAVNVASVLIPNMQQGNKLVFVDSMARLLPFTRSQAYGASKAALHYACKSFAVDLKDKGIAVQSMSPGFVKTPLTDKNDFPMPMAISAYQAAQYMLKGIQSNKSSIYFPRRFGVIMRLLNLLPQAVQGKICVNMRTSVNRASASKNHIDKQGN